MHPRRRSRARTARPLAGARIAAPVLLLGLAACLHVAGDRVASQAASPFPLARTVGFRPMEAQIHPDAVQLPPDRVSVPLAFTLRRGQTLDQALHQIGAADEDIAALVRTMATALRAHVDPRRLRPEDGYTAFLDHGGRLQALEVALVGRGRARLERAASGWRGEWKPYQRSVELRVVKGVLADSLEGAIRDAGADGVLAYRMADVLQWDLDFNRDLQPGDRFEVLYEAVLIEGQFDSVGTVLGMAYDNRGRRLEAYRFGDRHGYYDAEGRPLQKMFLRSPLPYSRITSRFSRRRFHPVLKTYRPHYGIDYGAPVGTPVRATAAGVVSFAAWDRGGGNTVKLRHPNDYLTAYLHLSRFASGIRAGRRVSQGEVIGYVGATGLATGPHLDYRVQHRSAWIDPLSLKSVPVEAVATGEMPLFVATRDTYRTAMVQGRPPQPPRIQDGELRLAAEATPGSESAASPSGAR